MAVIGQLHAPAAMSPGKNSGTPLIGGCVNSIVDPGVLMKF